MRLATLLFGHFANLVDNLLILTLGPEVERESTDGSNDASDTSSPEESIEKGILMKQIRLIHKPAKKNDNERNAD